MKITWKCRVKRHAGLRVRVHDMRPAPWSDYIAKTKVIVANTPITIIIIIRIAAYKSNEGHFTSKGTLSFGGH